MNAIEVLAVIGVVAVVYGIGLAVVIPWLFRNGDL